MTLPAPNSRNTPFRRDLGLMISVVNRIPFQPLELALFYKLEIRGNFEGLPESLSAEIREYGERQLPELVRCQDKKEKFLQRLKNGDRCIAAEVEGQTGGFFWFSTREIYMEERYGYEIPIPGEAVYVYDEYVQPNYRQRGLWKQLWAYMEKWMFEQGIDRAIILIDEGNHISWQAHTRIGFRHSSTVWYLRVGRAGRIFEKQVC